MSVTSTISAVTEKLIARSKPTRRRYLDRIEAAQMNRPARKSLGCANIAHGFAACGTHDNCESYIAVNFVVCHARCDDDLIRIPVCGCKSEARWGNRRFCRVARRNRYRDIR